MTPPADTPRYPSDRGRSGPEPLVVPGAAAIPVVVPHLLGFVPARSTVVLGFAPGGNRVVLSMRLDLPPEDADDDELVLAVQAWAAALGALDRAGAGSALIAIYPAEAVAVWADTIGPELPYAEVSHLLEMLVATSGHEVRDVLCVVGDRVRSYICGSLDCCPPEGVALDPSEALRISAALVGHGSAPLPDRAALVDSLAPRAADDPMRTAVEAARPGALAHQPAGVVDRVETFLHAAADWARELDAPGSKDRFPRLVASVALLMDGIAPRDYLLRELAVECDHLHVQAVREVLAEAVRCADAAEVPQLAAVLAVACWLAGDGAAARVAIDRAREIEPYQSLACLISDALDGGLPPWAWRESMREVTAEAILAADRRGPERWPA